MDANQGDRVRVEVETEGGSTVLEGRVLPAAAAKHFTLKLVNGYNVSHRVDRILDLGRKEVGGCGETIRWYQ